MALGSVIEIPMQAAEIWEHCSEEELLLVVDIR